MTAPHKHLGMEIAVLDFEERVTGTLAQDDRGAFILLDEKGKQKAYVSFVAVDAAEVLGNGKAPGSEALRKKVAAPSDDDEDETSPDADDDRPRASGGLRADSIYRKGGPGRQR